VAGSGDHLSMLEALVGLAFGGRSAHLDEATVLHYAGTSGFSGDYQGRTSVAELFHRMDDLTNGTMRFREWVTITAGEQGVVLRGCVAAPRSDSPMDSDILAVVSLRGNSVREIWLFHLDQAHVDQFWLEP
jgi:hypothetical protein